MGDAALKQGLVTVNCPVCGSARSKYLFSVRDYTFRVTDEEFGVRRCLGCSCGYLSPRPNEKDIGRYYLPEYYWSYEQADDPMTWDSLIASRRKQLDSKMRWLENMSPGRLLDIGAQKGEFLWQMQQLGWEVEGVEMDSSVPNPKAMPIRYGDFLSSTFEPSSYDCITMWAVLEHVYSPAIFVEHISKMLKPGGRFVAVVTNFDSIQGRFFHGDDYPRHLTYFTKKSVKRLCEDNGLVFEKMATKQDIFGGSLHGGLVYAVKRAFGYSLDDVMYEWRNIKEPESFCCAWKGKRSWAMRNLSRADRLLSLPLEFFLDKIGYGFNLTFSATKPIRHG